MTEIPENELPWFRNSLPQKRGRLRSVRAFVDFRPGIDYVVRRGDRCFIVDGFHHYADIEVKSDKLTPEAAERYRSLTGRHRENMAYAIWYTCLLSLPGKLERLAAMGIDLVFEILDKPDEQKEGL
jgi:hypothetical protein